MRTVVITDYPKSKRNRYPSAPGETWIWYPDANPIRSFYPGDQRAALAPFMAYRQLGDTFKWLLYGDDDTIFMTDAAVNLASTLDADLPYFVTDNLWWSSPYEEAWHPHPEVSKSITVLNSGHLWEKLQMFRL